MSPARMGWHAEGGREVWIDYTQAASARRLGGEGGRLRRPRNEENENENKIYDEGDGSYNCLLAPLPKPSDEFEHEQKHEKTLNYVACQTILYMVMVGL